MPILILTTIAAGAVLTAVAALLVVITTAIRREDRRTGCLRAPASGPLALATRRVTGLHVRHTELATWPPGRTGTCPGCTPWRR